MRGLSYLGLAASLFIVACSPSAAQKAERAEANRLADEADRDEDDRERAHELLNEATHALNGMLPKNSTIKEYSVYTHASREDFPSGLLYDTVCGQLSVNGDTIPFIYVWQSDKPIVVSGEETKEIFQGKQTYWEYMCDGYATLRGNKLEL